MPTKIDVILTVASKGPEAGYLVIESIKHGESLLYEVDYGNPIKIQGEIDEDGEVLSEYEFQLLIGLKEGNSTQNLHTVHVSAANSGTIIRPGA